MGRIHPHGMHQGEPCGLIQKVPITQKGKKMKTHSKATIKYPQYLLLFSNAFIPQSFYVSNNMLYHTAR